MPIFTQCPECGEEILYPGEAPADDCLRYYCQVCEKPVVLATKPDRPVSRILVVDDTESVRELIAEMLRQEGFDVATAADAREALEEMDRCRPDLVLLDLVLPGMDGFGLLSRLGKREGAAPPVLVMSGQLHQPEAISKAHALGAAGYIPKSALRDTLIFRVRNTLQPPAAQAG